jgi:hypothetical protein
MTFTRYDVRTPCNSSVGAKRAVPGLNLEGVGEGIVRKRGELTPVYRGFAGWVGPDQRHLPGRSAGEHRLLRGAHGHAPGGRLCRRAADRAVGTGLRPFISLEPASPPSGGNDR